MLSVPDKRLKRRYSRLSLKKKMAPFGGETGGACSVGYFLMYR